MNKTLNERVLEAKMMASLSKVESRDKHGRARTVLVPASEATLNQVIIRRYTNGVITTECRKQAGKAGYIDCPGNHNGVCRHSLAAIFKSLSEQGYTPRFRQEYEDALKFGLKHADVTFTNPDNSSFILFTLTSHQGKHAQLYFVAVEDEASKPVLKKAA